MALEILYHKVQGDGRDSWCVRDTENDSVYMVYEDPTQKPVPSVDVVKLLQSISPEELEAIKQILK